MQLKERLTLAVSSYSFHRLITSGEATLLDTPRLAYESGVASIEFAIGGSLTADLDQDLTASLRDACREVGVTVCSVVVAAELLRGEADQRANEIERITEQLEFAHALGAPRFRHDATIGPEGGDLSDDAFEAALPIVADACRTIAERAAALGIKSSVENHGLFMQHASRVVRLVHAVNHPSFGVTLDIGNSLFANQDHVQAARELASYAINVHIKDFFVQPSESMRNEHPDFAWQTYPGGPVVVGCAAGRGDVDIPACLQAVCDAGYTGPLVLEFEGPEPEPQQAVVEGLAYVREVVEHLANKVA